MSLNPSSHSLPVLEPMRLVLIPLQCFYCGNSNEATLHEWRICHLFGLFHCEEHTWCAERDCTQFLKTHGWIRKVDALAHPLLGPFLNALGPTFPILRTSGEIQQGWFFPLLDEQVPIRKSKTTQEWGLNVTNGELIRFVPFSQFRDPRLAALLTHEVVNSLEAVIACLESGNY